MQNSKFVGNNNFQLSNYHFLFISINRLVYRSERDSLVVNENSTIYCTFRSSTYEAQTFIAGNIFSGGKHSGNKIHIFFTQLSYR